MQTIAKSSFLCITQECQDPKAGNSKYCKVHKRVARDKFRVMVAEQAFEREDRYLRFEKAYALAHKLAQQAGEGHNPTPMVVQERATPLDDTSPVVKTYAPVMGGVCGFAWVTVYPGNSSFARWLAKKGLAGKAYYGGLEISVRGFGQSYERKMKYADKMAEVLIAELQDPKLKIYAGGRLD